MREWTLAAEGCLSQNTERHSRGQERERERGTNPSPISYLPSHGCMVNLFVGTCSSGIDFRICKSLPLLHSDQKAKDPGDGSLSFCHACWRASPDRLVARFGLRPYANCFFSCSLDQKLQILPSGACSLGGITDLTTYLLCRCTYDSTRRWLRYPYGSGPTVGMVYFEATLR